jgi:Rrf2 family cysteine metabolism transcriptional repressor
MRLPKKCQYALRAVFELAVREPDKPVKIHQIAAAQDIPPRFLESILNQLRHAGFVDSRRGSEGGYMLSRPAQYLTVGEIIEFIHGPISMVPHEGKTTRNSTFFGDEAFKRFWQEVNSVVSEICRNKTFADLVEFEQAKRKECVSNYCI